MNEFTKKRWTDRIVKEQAWGFHELRQGDNLSPFGILCEMAGEKVQKSMLGGWACLSNTVVPPRKVNKKMGISWEQGQKFMEFFMYRSGSVEDVVDYINKNF